MYLQPKRIVCEKHKPNIVTIKRVVEGKENVRFEATHWVSTDMFGEKCVAGFNDIVTNLV